MPASTVFVAALSLSLSFSLSLSLSLLPPFPQSGGNLSGSCYTQMGGPRRRRIGEWLPEDELCKRMLLLALTVRAQFDLIVSLVIEKKLASLELEQRGVCVWRLSNFNKYTGVPKETLPLRGSGVLPDL